LHSFPTRRSSDLTVRRPGTVGAFLWFSHRCIRSPSTTFRISSSGALESHRPTRPSGTVQDGSGSHSCHQQFLSGSSDPATNHGPPDDEKTIDCLLYMNIYIIIQTQPRVHSYLQPVH